MSVLFAEGFTGITRGTYSFPANNTIATASQNVMYKLGWLPAALYNGTTAGSSAANSIIAADPIFGDRNVLNLQKNPASGWTWVQYLAQAIDTTRHDKFVIGFMARMDGTSSQATQGMSVAVWDGSTLTTPPVNSGATTQPGMICRFFLPSDGVTAGIAMSQAGTETTTSDQLKAKADTHYELLIETDVQRLRAYSNGVLVLAVTYTGAFKTNGGFALGMWSGTNSSNANGTFNEFISNVYVLGVDAVHTGKLGPATRILELGPQNDKAVEWKRPDSFASNAAVLQQGFDSAAPKYLATGGVAKDLYGGFNAVSANAGELYGVGYRVRAQTMADGTHLLKGLVSYNGTEVESANTAMLQLAMPVNYSFDASINPATGAKWTVAELANAGIGMKLTQ